jgi:hypothetical protein
MPMPIVKGCNALVIVDMTAPRKVNGRSGYTSIVMNMSIIQGGSPMVLMDVGISSCNSQSGNTEHSVGVTVFKCGSKAVVMNVIYLCSMIQ